MNNENFIGLMSGTSSDAIDAVLADFSQPLPRLLATHSEPLPSEIQRDIRALCASGENELHRMGELDVVLGELFAKSVISLREKAPDASIKAIGSHGQTVRHMPFGTTPFTLQIGDPNIIAERTGITTVADFRRRDVCLGGQGAPLTPLFHRYLFQSNTENRAIVNIGGIANVTFLPSDQTTPIKGFDTGPGNTLLDAWITQSRNLPFDDQGNWARQGRVDEKLLQQMLNDPYFAQSAPKSTGKEYFNLQWVEGFASNISAVDLHATLLTLTAQSIAQAITAQTLPIDTVVLCGGGCRNTFLVESLQSLLGARTVISTDQFGIDPQHVEALAFAWFAQQTLSRQTMDLRTVTGSKQPVLLGGIYLGRTDA